MADVNQKILIPSADEVTANQEVTIVWEDQGDGTHIPKSSVSLKAGETVIGKVVGSSTIVDVAIAMSTAGAYTSGDFVGTNAAPLTFEDCARVNGGSGIIIAAALIDKNLQSIEGELWLFDDTVTPPNDNAAWSLSDDDMEKFLGVIKFSTYYASALNSGANAERPMAIWFKAQADSKDLFGCFVTRGTPTYASNGLLIRLMIAQD